MGWLSGQVLLHQLLCAGFQAASTASSTKLLRSLRKFSILFSSEWKMLCQHGEELLSELFAAACWWPATTCGSAAWLAATTCESASSTATTPARLPDQSWFHVHSDASLRYHFMETLSKKWT